MGDSETKFQSDVSHAALVAELSSLRDLLAEQNKQLNDLVDQLHDRNHRFTEQDEQLVKQDERLAELIKPVRVLQNEIRPLKKLPRRPDLKPSGLAESMQGNEEKPAFGSSSGSERLKKDRKGRRKGRGPRRRNPNPRCTTENGQPCPADTPATVPPRQEGASSLRRPDPEGLCRPILCLLPESLCPVCLSMLLMPVTRS